jgi:hypothetical protein
VKLRFERNVTVIELGVSLGRNIVQIPRSVRLLGHCACEDRAFVPSKEAPHQGVGKLVFLVHSVHCLFVLLLCGTVNAEAFIGNGDEESVGGSSC